MCLETSNKDEQLASSLITSEVIVKELKTGDKVKYPGGHETYIVTSQSYIGCKNVVSITTGESRLVMLDRKMIKVTKV